MNKTELVKPKFAVMKIRKCVDFLAMVFLLRAPPIGWSVYLLPIFAVLLLMGDIMNWSDAMYELIAGMAWNTSFKQCYTFKHVAWILSPCCLCVKPIANWLKSSFNN